MRFEYGKIFPDFVAYNTSSGQKLDKVRLFSSRTLDQIQGRRMLKRLFKEDIVPPPFPEEE